MCETSFEKQHLLVLCLINELVKKTNKPNLNLSPDVFTIRRLSKTSNEGLSFHGYSSKFSAVVLCHASTFSICCLLII